MISKFQRLFKFSNQIIKNLGVIGSGQMGTGIAIVANVIGKMNVKLTDTS